MILWNEAMIFHQSLPERFAPWAVPVASASQTGRSADPLSWEWRAQGGPSATILCHRDRGMQDAGEPFRKERLTALKPGESRIPG